jgi:hypothetical protein
MIPKIGHEIDTTTTYNTLRKQNKKNHSLIPKELRYEDYL